MPAGEQSPGMDLVFVLALAQYFLSAALHSVLIAFYGIPWGYALLAPLGSLLYTAIALDSMLRTLLGKGVSWKLRVYGRPSGGAKK
jgi:hypothetical protein